MIKINNMFTQRCFIHLNTEETRIRLKELGYSESIFYMGDLPFIFTEPSGDYGIAPCYSESDYGAPILFDSGIKAIDCSSNLDLFLAIAAMSDDSDYKQWFVTEADQAWVDIYCPKGNFELCLTKSRYPECWKGAEQFCSFVVPAHKATVEELIEHFNNK